MNVCCKLRLIAVNIDTNVFLHMSYDKREMQFSMAGSAVYVQYVGHDPTASRCIQTIFVFLLPLSLTVDTLECVHLSTEADCRYHFVQRFTASASQSLCFVFAAVLASRCYSHGKQETDEEFDARWITYFNKPDIDAWELRKGRMAKDFVYHLNICFRV